MHASRFPVLFLAALLVDSATAQGPGRVPGGLPDANREGSAPQTRTSLPVRPILITGNVRTSSGEAPSEAAAIKRMCGSETFIEGYTGHKGRFSFQIGGAAWTGVMDASVDGASPGGPQGDVSIFNDVRTETGLGVDLSRCRLIADLAGFQSSSIQLGRRRALDRPDVGTLVLTPLDGLAIAPVSATTLAAPKQAQKAFKKARKELSKGQAAKLPRALALLKKAVTAYPSYAAAWSLMGETKQRMGNSEGAAEAFSRALDADSGYLRAYEPMIVLRIERSEWQRALDLTNAALRLNPLSPILQWLNAVSLFELGSHNEALAALDRVERDKGGAELFPQTHRLRGLIYAQRGDFIEAAAELRRFLQAAPASPLAEAVQKQLAEWKALGVA